MYLLYIVFVKLAINSLEDIYTMHCEQQISVMNQSVNRILNVEQISRSVVAQIDFFYVYLTNLIYSMLLRHFLCCETGSVKEAFGVPLGLKSHCNPFLYFNESPAVLCTAYESRTG